MSTKRSVAKKSNQTASKAWKEQLRQACLGRAQLRRWRHCSNQDNDNDDGLSPRAMVEEELFQRGISLVSPSLAEAPAADGAQSFWWPVSPREIDDGKNEMEDFSMDVVGKTKTNYHITEEELFQLLEEVEEEMQRQDALRLEEVLEMKRDEELFLQNQIADFEYWQ
jgi:hypothetical protein